MSSTENFSQAEHAPHGVITKDTDHLFGQLLLGEIVAAHWLGDALILYYGDKHKVLIKANMDDLIVKDHEVPGC